MSTAGYLASLLAVLVIFAAVCAVAIASHFYGDTGSEDPHA